MNAAIDRDAEAIEREFDRLDERNGGAKRQRQSLSQSEFDRCAAEAKVELGEELVIALLTRTARRFGWPIPAEHRVRVAALIGLALSRAGDDEEGGGG